MSGIIMLVAMAAFGCGASASSAPSAAEQCNHMGEVLCDSNANCAVLSQQIASDQRAAYVSSCTASYEQAAACSNAKLITGQPDQCEQAITSASCSTYVPSSGLPLPASCRGVFNSASL